jgi:CheY-like chemotaxis protein
MDVRMPGMGGLEALRQLRSRDSTVVLVAFTAGGLDSLSADARTAGADDVFLKPYKDGDLLRLVGDRLGLVYTDATQGPEEGLTRLFAKLPAPLLEQLRVAAIEARPAHLEVLAVQAEAHAPGVAEPIRALVRQFQYDKLLAALECSSSAPVE